MMPALAILEKSQRYIVGGGGGGISLWNLNGIRDIR